MGNDYKPRVFILGSFGPSVVRFRLPLIEKIILLGGQVCVGVPLDELSPEDVGMLRSRSVEMFDIPVERHGMNPFSEMKYIGRVFRALRAAKADVFIPYTVKPVIFGSFAARLAGLREIYPMVTGLGSIFIGDEKTKSGKAVQKILVTLYNLAFRQAKCAFFQNADDPKDLAALKALPPGTGWKILAGSGVDLDHYEPAALPADLKKPQFLMISRIIADKGVREYAEAARQLKDLADFRLVGPLDTNPSAIKPDEVASWAWLDYKPWTDDVRPDIAACSVYVLPSYREGTPRSVLEAMACGRAVITTDAPGCRECVADGINGFLVQVRDSQSLADAMRKFIENPALIAKMGEEAREIAVGRYDAKKTYDPLLKTIGLMPE